MTPKKRQERIQPEAHTIIRAFENQKILALNNFSDVPQKMDRGRLEMYGAREDIVKLLRHEVVSI